MELKPVANEVIKKIALENGFQLKLQPSGDYDLNPYVYDFAQDLIAKMTDYISLFNKDQDIKDSLEQHNDNLRGEHE